MEGEIQKETAHELKVEGAKPESEGQTGKPEHEENESARRELG